ncbi:hypothetical protein E6H23_00740, partial [Candidatus Bathyarchaeota archaeon]
MPTLAHEVAQLTETRNDIMFIIVGSTPWNWTELPKPVNVDDCPLPPPKGTITHDAGLSAQ